MGLGDKDYYLFNLTRCFWLGVLCAVMLLGCAGISFRYYGLSQVIYEHGKLLGPKPKDDLPFSKCQPNAQSKNPCVVMFAPEFFSLKKDYEDTKQKLKECEAK